MTKPAQHINWSMCEACGRWQQVLDAMRCGVCDWPRLLDGDAAEAAGPAIVRVLVETEMRPDSAWRVSRFDAGRLEGVIESASMVSELNEVLLPTKLRSAVARGDAVGWAAVDWGLLRAAASEHVDQRVLEVLSRDWPSRTAPARPNLRVSMRALVMTPEFDAGDTAQLDWLELVPLSLAVARNAASLDNNALVIGEPTPISLAPNGNRLAVTVTSPVEILLERIALGGGPAPSNAWNLWQQEISCFVRQDSQTKLGPVMLPAEAIRTMGSPLRRDTKSTLLLYAKGRPEPFEAALPGVDLPEREVVVDLMLDLGSTSTKWLLQFRDRAEVLDQETAAFTRILGLPTYEKREFISEPSGERWCDWVSQALPKLREWVGKEYRAYLRHVYLSLPRTRDFDVGRLLRVLGNDRLLPGSTSQHTSVTFKYPVGSESSVTLKGSFDGWGGGVPMTRVGGYWIARLDAHANKRILYRFVVDGTAWVSDPAHPPAPDEKDGNSSVQPSVVPDFAGQLKVARAAHLVADGALFLQSEHNCVADQYLSVLRALKHAAERFMDRRRENERTRAGQERAQREWERMDSLAREYREKPFFIRLFSKRPDSPSGSRPDVVRGISSPADWMRDIVAYPERLNRVLIIDVGGLSLDIAVLDRDALCVELSHSDAGCGGEAISLAVGRRAAGASGTRYKAQLGIRWAETGDLSIQPQSEYRDETRRILRAPLSALFSKLHARWRTTPDGWVVLTGGGAKNPHLVDFVMEMAAEFRLGLRLADSNAIADMVEIARKFEEPLPELDSPAIRAFERTLEWSARREQNSRVRYDKFAIVGGMCAGAIETGGQ